MKDIYKRYEIDKLAKIFLITANAILMVGYVLMFIIKNETIVINIAIVSVFFTLLAFGHIIYTDRIYKKVICQCKAYLWQRKKTKQAFHLCPYCGKKERMKPANSDWGQKIENEK